VERIEVSRVFPVSPAEAFAYVTDMGNWPSFLPGFVRIEDAACAQWGKVGDRVMVVVRLFGREAKLDMELEEFQEGERVKFVLRQAGLPKARHERHFQAKPGGCECRFVVVFEPRPGIAALYDRLLVKWGITTALRRGLDALDSAFGRGANS
jgi:ribosome-associated toxin RatA of RatAB toxin-antitoxin module